MAVNNSPSNSSNLLNITIQNESENYRNIRRNSSKQIVSYTIEEGTQPDEYGFKRIPGEVIRFDANQYKRNIPQISKELINPLPVIESEITDANLMDETKLYYAENLRLRRVRGEDPEEPLDTFSARYELTPAALSRRDVNPDEIAEGFRQANNTHFGGISYNSDAVQDATNGYITFPGHKELVWDNKVFGPDLQQYGYRITQELKDSGRNLNIRAVVSFRVGAGSNDVAARAAIRRKRAGEWQNPVTNLDTQGQVYDGEDAPHYPMLQCVLDVPNSDLRVNDLYQISSVFGSRSDGCFIYGDKCVFEVTCQLPEEPEIIWPSDFSFNAAANSNVIETNTTVEAEDNNTQAG
jgi:hypothetical protein